MKWHGEMNSISHTEMGFVKGTYMALKNMRDIVTTYLFIEIESRNNSHGRFEAASADASHSS